MTPIRPIPTEETWAPSDRLWFWTRQFPFAIIAIGVIVILCISLSK